MIKSQATINGVISKPATMRTNKDGKTYLAFTVKITVPGSRNNMQGKEVYISVCKDGMEAEIPQYVVGNRIEATGSLTFRKVASKREQSSSLELPSGSKFGEAKASDNLYLNFYADCVNLSPEKQKDAIDGTLEFKGTVGKSVDVKTDKKGKQYVAFSAFSTEKSGDTLQFTWVRFIKFDYTPDAFLQPKAKIEAKGKLSVSAYLDRIDLDCRLEEVKEWERLPFPPANPNEKTPF